MIGFCPLKMFSTPRAFLNLVQPIQLTSRMAHFWLTYGNIDTLSGQLKFILFRLFLQSDRNLCNCPLTSLIFPKRKYLLTSVNKLSIINEVTADYIWVHRKYMIESQDMILKIREWQAKLENKELKTYQQDPLIEE